MRIALGVEYDGTAYHGWQKQNGLITLQNQIERGLSAIADHSVEVTCAGRTDAGVHALGQVLHFDTTVTREDHAWVLGTNTYLPIDIRVIWARPVDDLFHARYTAVARRYQYVIYNDPIQPAIFRHQLSWYRGTLNEDRMMKGAQYLIGEHDFSSYRGIDCQSKNPFRHVHSIKVIRKGNLVLIDIKANAFLHHMVRNIAGVLMEIGNGKREPVWAQEVLMARDRTVGGITALPNGLYLMQVFYPDKYPLPPGRALELF